MLILGEKYTFTELELQRLKQYTIHAISCLNKNPLEILNDLNNTISNNAIVTIILNTEKKVDDSVIQYLTSLQFQRNIEILTIEHFLEEYLQKCYISDDLSILNFLDNIKPYSKWQYFQKRCIDFFGLFWLFFFSWPVLLLCKRRIQKQSPGSILFVQDRVGKDNKIFRCKKFRTMHENSHHDPYTRENDSRIFAYGETMRKYRFDELPQMINILKGEMHLIGPRAEWSLLVESYKTEIPYYNERHLVAPGVTGWAQVMYPYGANVEDAKQKLMYDLYYIKHWNILFELKIVWMTAMTVIRKKGV